METAKPDHTEAVRALLHRLEEDRDNMLQVGMHLMGSAGGNMYLLDFLALGAIKRFLNTTTAFRSMIESWNMVCARALLRIHIDTALRFSAAWLVEDPHEFASKVLAGEQINRFKDTSGERLYDAHLVKMRSREFPWLPAVYRNLSSYVHLSASHIFDSIAKLDDTTRIAYFELSDTDLKFPEFSWRELLECFREATKMLTQYLSGYAAAKGHGNDG